MNFLQHFIVVNIGQVDQHVAESDITRNALRCDRQFQVTAAVQAGLDLGDNGSVVFVDHIQSQPVGIEQLANVLAGLQHDLFNVVGFMDARRHVLQLLVKQCFKGHAIAFDVEDFGARVHVYLVSKLVMPSQPGSMGWPRAAAMRAAYSL